MTHSVTDFNAAVFISLIT